MIETGYFAQQTLSVADFLQSINNPLWKDNFGSPEEMYDDAQVFANGSCHLFAYALNEKYGYEIIESRSMICTAQCHFFCCTKLNNQIIYLDVRGATTNCDDFFRGLGYESKEEYKLINHSCVDIDKELSEGGASFGYTFAKHIIELHSEYYEIVRRKDE